MRITNSMMSSTMLMNLNNSLRRMNKGNTQMVTGKKFSMPSDDPIGVSKSLALNTAVAQLERHKKNAEDATSWFQITETAVAEVSNILLRAKELAVSADGLESKVDKEKIKVEIDQLTEELVNLSNTSYSGKHVFSGYRTEQKLLDENGKYINEIKNKEKMDYQVSIGDTIDVNTLGHKLFGIAPNVPNPADLDTVNTGGTTPNDGANAGETAQLIGVFEALSKALGDDNQTDIGKSIGRIEKHLDNVLSVRGEIGAKTRRMEMSIDRIEQDIINFTALLSKNEDADMAEVIMKFKNDENVYRAALSTGAKVIQPSLVDFIR
ncbi:flagellar hook-associated protein 3 FlgL [Marinisporobacter balticus]|uniref:Flagellar hook-associated protein 3 FlgL n=2 Tax=Marinisporobacter balticus TaxID=2018667 RepID=A0A4R2KYI4_9FIRM|nr:flagellar hook-associated protein 3 FlgL [Marinisporobacter balticus]